MGTYPYSWGAANIRSAATIRSAAIIKDFTYMYILIYNPISDCKSLVIFSLKHINIQQHTNQNHNR